MGITYAVEPTLLEDINRIGAWSEFSGYRDERRYELWSEFSGYRDEMVKIRITLFLVCVLLSSSSM